MKVAEHVLHRLYKVQKYINLNTLSRYNVCDKTWKKSKKIMHVKYSHLGLKGSEWGITMEVHKAPARLLYYYNLGLCT